MHKIHFVAVAVAGCLVCQGAESLWSQGFPPTDQPAAAPAGSLVNNPDFVTAGPTGDWPAGWGTKTPGSGVAWEVENGRHFLRLVSQTPGRLQTLYQSDKLVPGKIRAMKVSIRYRASGVQPGKQPGEDARALWAFQDADGRTLDAQAPPLVFSPATGWMEVCGQFLVPENATRWTLVAGLLHAAAGTLDLGEITAVPLGAEETAALLAAQPKDRAAPVSSWVQDDDFSKPDADGKWPAEWGKPGLGMSWQTENDTHFVRIALQSPGQVLMLNKTISLQPGAKGINLLIRWRADGVQHGEHEWFDARTIVHFLGADGQQLPTGEGDFLFTHKPAPTGWKEGVKSYMIPEGAVALQLMAGFFKANAGTVDLAEIRVTPMKDATADLQRITSAAYRIWKDDEDAAMDRKTGRQIDEQLAATGNLVPNGGFATVDKDGKPADWGKQLADGITWQEENGTHFMRLVSQNPQKIRMLYRMIPLPFGIKGVEITLRYRTAGVTKGGQSPGDARVAMHYLDGLRFGHLENGKEIIPAPADIELSFQAKDWTEVRRRYLVSAGATKLQFMPGLWHVEQGTLDIANIRVTPLSDADTQALSAPARVSNRQQVNRD